MRNKNKLIKIGCPISSKFYKMALDLVQKSSNKKTDIALNNQLFVMHNFAVTSHTNMFTIRVLKMYFVTGSASI